MANTFVASTGRFVPSHRPSSAALETELGLAAGWIEQRTGVRNRAIAESDHAVSDLAVNAAKKALAGLDVHSMYSNPELGCLLLATSTPDLLLPPTAPTVAHRLGLSVAAMDLTVACCGFLYGLILANAIARVMQVSVMLIGANILSRRCDPRDPATSAIFADGAGAVILSPTDSGAGILATIWNSDGSNASTLTIPDGGSRHPIDSRTFAAGRHFMQISDGGSIFKMAVQSMARDGAKAVSQAGYRIEDVDWWIPHQANLRIIEATRRLLGMDEKKTLVTIDKYGNSSAATIPITLDEYLSEKKWIKAGDLVLMTAAGAGMTSAAVLMRMQ